MSPCFILVFELKIQYFSLRLVRGKQNIGQWEILAVTDVIESIVGLKQQNKVSHGIFKGNKVFFWVQALVCMHKKLISRSVHAHESLLYSQKG